MEDSDHQLALEARVERLTRELDELKIAVAAQAPATPLEEVGPPLQKRTSRRNLLRLAGTGAAAAGVAAASGLLNATPAAATQGSSIVAGNYNSETSYTQVDNVTSGGTGLYATQFGANGAGLWGGTDVGVGTRGEATTGMGVYGTATGANGVGVKGNTASTGYGVFGNATTSGTGVYGFSSTGYGGVFWSSSGVDLYAYGTGRIRQWPSGFVGAPTSGTYSKHEMVRDNNGDMFICVSSGTPGTWKKVASGAPGFDATSGSINFLSAPIRLLDTRPSQPAASGGAGPYAALSQTNLQVAGVTYNAITIPTGAIGVVGNVTVTNTAGGGFLTLFPQGSPRPLSSSLNYGTGQTINNSTTVGLSPTTGQLTIYTQAQTDIIFDAVGFMF